MQPSKGPIEVVTGPTARFLEDARVWDHLRRPLSGSPAAPDDEAQIAAYRNAAEAALDGPDGELGRAIITQTLRLTLDTFPFDGLRAMPIVLPMPPYQSVSSVTYIDRAGSTQTLASGAYYVVNGQSQPTQIWPAPGTVWPSTQDRPAAVTVEWVAGYGDAASNVPQDIIAAGLLMLADLYENRAATEVGATIARNPSVDRLLAKHRVRTFG